MRLSNPVVGRIAAASGEIPIDTRATYGGIAAKCILFAGTTILSAVIAFFITSYFLTYTWAIILTVACPLLALVFGLTAGFAPSTVKVTGTLYTIFEGLAIGCISCLFEMQYGGIVFSALIATVATFAVMSVLFGTGVIKVGRKFRSFMLSALIALVVSQLIIFLLSWFIPGLSAAVYGNNLLGVIISCVMVLFASLMILFDLSTISMVVENGMDKSFEWRASFGLVLTLIWLYIEFLQLFARFASRSK